VVRGAEEPRQGGGAGVTAAAINGGSVRWLGLAVTGEEGAGTAVGECGGALKTEWRRRTGAGSRGGGTAARVAARPRGEEEGGAGG
jgi:hypothetical protein